MTAAPRPVSRQTMREAVLDAIHSEMDQDPSVIMLGQDVGQFGGPLRATEGLAAAFGDERVLEMPICEASMTGLAIGAAMQGFRPIVDIMFGDMLTVATTELIQQAATVRYMTNERARVPVVIRTRAGDGPYRAHPQHLEALFSHTPGLTVVVPSTPVDAKALMRAAIRSDDPVLFIENVFLYNGPSQPVSVDDLDVRLGSAALVRSGRDVTVVTYGRPVMTAAEAARRLVSEGIEVEIIDLRTVAPFDRTAVAESVSRTGRLLVVHEAWTRGGIGAEVVAAVAEDVGGAHAIPTARIGAPDIPIPYAKQLRDATLITVDQITSTVRSLVGERGTHG